MAATNFPVPSSDSRPTPDNSHYARAVYLACEIITSMLLLITVYVLSSMVFYGIRANKWRKGIKSDVNAGLVYTIAVLAVAFTIPRYVANQVIFNITNIHGASNSCELIMDVGNAFYFCAMCPIYFFLWMRQKTLYGHPAMRRLAGRFIALFSWTTLVLLLVAAIGVCLLFIVPANYTNSPEGCVLSESVVNASYEGDFAFYGSYYALLALLITAQVLLLSLFIYPMLRSSAIRRVNQTSRQSSKISLPSSPDDSDPLERGRKSWILAMRRLSRRFSSSSNGRTSTLEITIRRSVVCAAISMTSDIVTMALVTFIVPREGPRAVSNTIYDIGTLISVFCVLGTFQNYWKILGAFCNASKRTAFDSTASVSDDYPNKYSDHFHSVSRQESYERAQNSMEV